MILEIVEQRLLLIRACSTVQHVTSSEVVLRYAPAVGAGVALRNDAKVSKNL